MSRNLPIGHTAKMVERAKEIIAYYNQLLADMDYSAELYAQDKDLAEAFLAAIKDAERYRFLRVRINQLAFGVGPIKLADAVLDAEIDRQMNSVIDRAQESK